MNKRAFVGFGLVAGLTLTLAWAGCKPVERTFGSGGGQATGTGGNGGHGGGSGTCKAGDMVDCYSGPDGTKDVGSCHGGKALCGADGKPGTCENEVTPAAAPTCDATMDQNCDGTPDYCPLDLLWAKAYGVMGNSNFSPPSLGVDPQGNILFAGYLNGQLDFGKNLTLFSSAGDADVFVAKIDPKGETVWAKKFGDSTGDQYGKHAKVDAKGNVVVVGSYEGGLDGLGIGVSPSAGGTDAFVVKLDPTGAPMWARVGGDTSYQSAESVVLTPGGDVIVAGTYSGTFNFLGGTTFANTAGGGDVIFIQRFDKDGNAVWSKSLGNDATLGYSDQEIYTMAVDVNGDIIVTGFFTNTISFPNQQSYTSAGGEDIFVMKLRGSDGQVLWVRTFGGMNDDQNYGVVTDAQGSIFLAGAFDGSLTIGSTTVMPQAGQKRGLYLAKLTPAGQPAWVKSFGSGENVAGMFVETDQDNNLLLVGGFDGTVDFGGGPIQANTMKGSYGGAGFLAKLDSNGNHLASRGFSPIPPQMDGGSQQFPSLVITYRVASTPGTNEIVTAGLAFGEFDLGGGVIGKPITGSPFLGKFHP
ncbi:MAG: hypothetical protein QM820_54240 [Minicystis sp.]